MATNANTCTCEPCAGPTCTCGCQDAASEAQARCNCGEACACGEACDCATRSHAAS